MGIRIFLEEKKNPQLESNFYDRNKGIVKAGVAVTNSLLYLFDPKEVTKWQYLAEDEVGGKNLGSVSYSDFQRDSENEEKQVGYFSVLRINGTWKIGEVEREGFISINISPYARVEGDLYMDVRPSIYEDINEIIYMQDNRKEIIRSLVESVRSVKVEAGSLAFSIKRMLGEDEEYPLFIYSKDRAIAWKSAQEYLEKDNYIREVKPYYNWDNVYTLFLEKESAKSVMRETEHKYGLIEEGGSVLLIGTKRESLDNALSELSKKLKKFMESLERKQNLEQKIDETFGGQTPIYKE